MSKATPSAVTHFAHLGSTSSAHQEQTQIRLSRLGSSFRTTNDTSSGIGTDHDLGRFASTTKPIQRSSFEPGLLDQVWSSSSFSSSSTRGQELESDVGLFETRNGWQDGEEIQSILQSSSLNEELQTGWEEELEMDQRRKRTGEMTMPFDPPATKSRPFIDLDLDTNDDRSKMSNGDASPTSRELVERLDMMDISSRSYLKTLLAAREGEAISDYLEQGSYADDVWGVPMEVKQVLQKVVQDQKEDVEGKSKALRRLDMLMRHLNAESTQSSKIGVGIDVKGKGKEKESEWGMVDLDGMALQHVMTRRPSELGPKHSSAMSTPPNGLIQERFHDFASLRRSEEEQRAERDNDDLPPFAAYMERRLSGMKDLKEQGRTSPDREHPEFIGRWSRSNSLTSNEEVKEGRSH